MTFTSGRSSERNVHSANTNRSCLGISESGSVWLQMRALSCRHSVPVCLVRSRSSRHRCMSAWPRLACIWARVQDRNSRMSSADTAWRWSSFSQRRQRCGVKNKQDRAKNWALWGAKGNIRRFWTMAIDSLSLTSKVRLKQRNNGARNAVERLKSEEESLGFDSIKSNRQVDRHITTVQIKQNAFSQFQQRHVSAVTWTVITLGRVQEVMGI